MMDQILESIDFSAVIEVIVTAVVIPLIVTLGKQLRKFIADKRYDLICKQSNDACIYWINSLAKLVDDAVVATNQTFVDALKSSGEFTEEKWNEAYEKTKKAVLNSLSENAISILKGAVGDLDIYLNTLIQASVKKNKNIVSQQVFPMTILDTTVDPVIDAKQS